MKISIIDVTSQRPKIKVFLERFLAFVFTLGLWALLFYGLGTELIGPKRMQSLEMLSFLLGIALLIFLILGSWQYYNWHRFHGKDRRKAFRPQPIAEVAKLYGMSEADMKIVQQPARQVDVYYENGRYYYQLPKQPRIEIGSLRGK